MPVEISVGPPALTINQGRTFLVTDLGGEIAADTEHGVYADDTRFVSSYAIFANGQPWARLTSAATTYFAARIYLSNQPFATEEREVPGGTLALVISRTVSGGIHEDLDVTNYGPMPVRFNLEIAIRCDFADLFEVKSHRFVRRGRIVTAWDAAQRQLCTTYTNGDFERTFLYCLRKSGTPPGYANGRVVFEIELQPGIRAVTMSWPVGPPSAAATSRRPPRPRSTASSTTGRSGRHS